MIVYVHCCTIHTSVISKIETA